MFASALLIVAAPSCSVEDARVELAATHHAVIEAHLDDDLDAWRDAETAEIIESASGRVRVRGEGRWSGRRRYLQATEFTRYADRIEPIIEIADDCSRGWAIVEVDVQGHSADDPDETFAYVFSWVELYRNTSSGWRISGVVSNGRPVESD